MKRLDSFVNDLFDIIIQMVKIGGGVVKEEVDLIKKSCKSDEIMMWNGGVTNEGMNSQSELYTNTPKDEIEKVEIMEMNGPHIIYDGIYEDEVEGEIQK